MVLAYLLIPQLGLTGDIPYLIVFGVIVVSYIMCYIARLRSPLLEKNLEHPPKEIEMFYRKSGE